MVDAALTLPDGSIHIFDGPDVIPARLAESGLVPQGVPLPLDTTWQLMPFDRIDAAFVSGQQRAYFFAGNQYCIHDASTRTRIEGPKPIRDHWNVDNWERLPEAWDRDYSASAFWPGNGKAWFFKGTEYLRYDLSADRVDTSVDGQWVYPLPITRHWKLPYPSPDAFTVVAGDRGLMFSGRDWAEYDVRRHEVLRTGRLAWSGPEVSGPGLIPRLPPVGDLTRWTAQPVIDRSRLAPWRPLIDHRLERDEPPTHTYFVMTREAFPQELSEGAGPVSLDCYGVVVDRWPRKQDGSTRYTLEEATQHIRTRLNLMTFGVSSGIVFGGFAPFDEDVDGPVWSSTTPLGASGTALPVDEDRWRRTRWNPRGSRVRARILDVQDLPHFKAR